MLKQCIVMEESEVGSIGEYAILCRLGGGAVSQSQVWKAEHKRSGQVVALKQIRLSNLTPHLNNSLHSSLTFLSSVNHPNIIRLFHFFQAEDCVVMVLEFCDGGNLASYIHHHGRVQQCVAKGFIQQLDEMNLTYTGHCRSWSTATQLSPNHPSRLETREYSLVLL